MRRSGALAIRKPTGETAGVRASRREVSPRKPTAIDKHVGKRLRLLRQINEVSLEKLAEIVDVAPQQIQKYEIGETRISASRIYELSRIFRVPVAWFYHDLEASTSAEVQARFGGSEGGINGAGRTQTPASQESLLATYYAQLPPDLQQKLVELARMLSDLSAGQTK